MATKFFDIDTLPALPGEFHRPPVVRLHDDASPLEQLHAAIENTVRASLSR